MTIYYEENNEINLVFTDTVLPDKNGVQLVSDLQTINPDLRVILSSGYTGDRVQREALQDTNYSFITKPYDLTELLKTIKEVITIA